MRNRRALKKACVRQVEHRERVRADPRADEHVPDLAHRRVGDDALDVPLDERDHPRRKKRDQPEDRREVLDVWRGLEDEMRAADEVDAGGDHRRRVDERGDRRRSLHRVGEPGVERDLRGLRDGAGEEAEGEQRDDGVRQLAALRRGEDGAVVEAPDLGDREEEGERHRRVADGVDHERLLRGVDRAAGGRGRSRSGGTTRGRRAPSRRAAAAGCRPSRASASRRRRTPCRRSTAAPRPRPPCSRSSRGRSGRRPR